MKGSFLQKIKLYGLMLLSSGFLAFLYPEVWKTWDTVTVLEDTEEDLYMGLLRAKPEQIRFRSRIYELLKNFTK